MFFLVNVFPEKGREMKGSNKSLSERGAGSVDQKGFEGKVRNSSGPRE